MEDSEAQVQVLIYTQHISPRQCFWWTLGQMLKSMHSFIEHRLVLQKLTQLSTDINAN